MVELSADEAIALLRTEEEKMRAFEGQRQQLLLSLQELAMAKASLEAIPDKKEDALIPIGGGVFLPVEAGNKKVNIEIGGGIVAEKTVEEAMEILNKREELINANLSELNEELKKIAQRAQKLSDKIKEYLERQRQGNVPVIG